MHRACLSMLAFTVLMLGCDLRESDTPASLRLVELQSDQNRRMIELQHGLQEQQAAIHRGRDELERERQRLAVERIQAPIIAEAICWTGTLLCCLAPVLLAWGLVHHENREPDAVGITDAIVQDLRSPPKSVLISALVRKPAEAPKAIGGKNSTSTQRNDLNDVPHCPHPDGSP